MNRLTLPASQPRSQPNPSLTLILKVGYHALPRDRADPRPAAARLPWQELQLVQIAPVARRPVIAHAVTTWLSEHQRAHGALVRSERALRVELAKVAGKKGESVGELLHDHVVPPAPSRAVERCESAFDTATGAEVALRGRGKTTEDGAAASGLARFVPHSHIADRAADLMPHHFLMGAGDDSGARAKEGCASRSVTRGIGKLPPDIASARSDSAGGGSHTRGRARPCSADWERTIQRSASLRPASADMRTATRVRPVSADGGGRPPLRCGVSVAGRPCSASALCGSSVRAGLHFHNHQVALDATQMPRKLRSGADRPPQCGLLSSVRCVCSAGSVRSEAPSNLWVSPHDHRLQQLIRVRPSLPTCTRAHPALPAPHSLPPCVSPCSRRIFTRASAGEGAHRAAHLLAFGTAQAMLQLRRAWVRERGTGRTLGRVPTDAPQPSSSALMIVSWRRRA